MTKILRRSLFLIVPIPITIKVARDVYNIIMDQILVNFFDLGPYYILTSRLQQFGNRINSQNNTRILMLKSEVTDLTIEIGWF